MSFNRFISNAIQGSYLFHDGGRYHIETSPLIYGANQWTSFYMITASVMKELTRFGIPELRNRVKRLLPPPFF